MATYRIYSVDQYGGIFGERWVDAAHDQEAIALVQAMGRRHECEVWARDRRVAKVPATPV